MTHYAPEMGVGMHSAALLLMLLYGSATAGQKLVGIGDVLVSLEVDRRDNLDLAETALPIDRTIYLVERIRLPAGSTLEWNPERKSYCSADKGYISQSGIENPVCLIDDNADGRFDRLDGRGIVRPIKLKSPVPYTKRIGSVYSPSKVTRRIIYLGGTATEAKFSYREFTEGGMARPAFTEDLSVPIQAYPAPVTLKGVRFTILKQASDGLTVEMGPPH